MKTGPLVAVDKQIDNVEDVQGRPGEEEDHAYAHQNPDHINCQRSKPELLPICPFPSFELFCCTSTGKTNLTS